MRAHKAIYKTGRIKSPAFSPVDAGLKKKKQSAVPVFA